MTSQKLDIILHAGAHKTATTHLQGILQDNRKRLQASGTTYVGPHKIRQNEGNIYTALGIDLPELDRNDHLRKLARGNTRLLVSEENVCGRCTSHAGKLRLGGFYPNCTDKVARYGAGLMEHNLHFCFAVREPSKFVTSLYSQVMLSNRYTTWKSFRGDVDLPEWKWSDMILDVVDQHPWASFTLWRYEDYHDIFPKITRLLLGSDHPDLKVKLKKRSHAGLSKAAVDACRKWHAEGYTGPLGHIAREDYPISDENRPFQPWGHQIVKACKANYAADMDMLANHPKITVLNADDAKG